MRLYGRIVVVCIVIASVACGGKSPTSPGSSSSSGAYNGTWTGRGSAGGSTTSTGIVSFEFTVANNSITRFSLTHRFFSGTTACTFVSTASASITNNAFTYAFSAAGVTSTVTGTFSSNTQGSGSVGRLDLANVQCAGTINGFTAGESITFTKS